MKRCVSEHQFCGFEIGTHCGEHNLDDAMFDPIYKVCWGVLHKPTYVHQRPLISQTASDLGVCLFVHPWDMHTWDGRMQKYWLPWLVG